MLPSTSITSPLLRSTSDGLYCEAGDFYIDPRRKVARALITHAHSDHARPGMGSYLTAASGVGVLRERIGAKAVIRGLAFDTRQKIGDVEVSFHPAGHLLGSAQIRVAHKGEVWVVTGDYKNAPDPSCEAFAPVKCHHLITEATFALPVYQWPDADAVFRQLHDWWRGNQAAGISSIVFAYSLGKAQRVLCGLDASLGPIGVHRTVDQMLPHYRAEGRPIPPTVSANRETRSILRGRGLVVAPGAVRNTAWIERFAPYSIAMVSGWMLLRSGRRRGGAGVDRGFVLSDHVDWRGILDTIDASGAQRIGVTHGYADPLVRWLTEHQGLEAYELKT